MSKTTFTVILPTTGNRGSLLPYSIGSIQNQTIQDFEIFIIGDGISDEARDLIGEMRKKDSRIRLFDHPKHERRGEPYRHKALQKAGSDYVCYLCDRDMMLPDHFETVAKLHKEYNFISTRVIPVRSDNSLTIGTHPNYVGLATEKRKKIIETAIIPLSSVSHTIELYHKLPYGWRTTPVTDSTDIYMWKQFLAHKESAVYSHYIPTILYFKRGNFPGAPISERKTELNNWSKRITNLQDADKIRREAFHSFLEEKIDLQKKVNSPPLITVKGHSLKDVPKKIIRKAANRLMKL
ncbi:glycosyltransferase family A protein [Rhodohalobacter sulfatireducens]|uniref:Glycosyltransferase family 2 protein n=1 Tax=Rhodohalobacter sulfatireducens TaxID=2911366 RepID=A0ABS9KEX3_9BACT|nr:glycosyltransferase family A protein [Rhodohalobacter sulfatireducens]MCG2589394.1 glycosyltransferase family 2 protein [Rhodohalobacter sulfatireducens]